MKCIICNGIGKQSLTVVEGETESTSMIDCIYCSGTGQLTEQELSDLKAEQDLWCSCGNPSDEATYWEDGENPDCDKHCWTCNDCEKIIQVG